MELYFDDLLRIGRARISLAELNTVLALFGEYEQFLGIVADRRLEGID